MRNRDSVKLSTALIMIIGGVLLIIGTASCNSTAEDTQQGFQEIVLVSTSTLTPTATTQPTDISTATSTATPTPTPSATSTFTPTPAEQVVDNPGKDLTGREQTSDETEQKNVTVTPINQATATPLPTREATPIPVPVVAQTQTYLLAYSKWNGQSHDLYLADTNGNNQQLFFTRATGPSFAPRRLFFFGEQGVDQQIRDNRVVCGFGTISEGLVAVDLPSALTDICQIQYDAWFCERKIVDIGAAPSDVCTANEISIFQNLDWKEGSTRWTSVSPDNQAVVFDAKPGSDTYRLYFRNVAGTSQQAHIEILGEQGSWSPDSQRLVYRSGRDNKQGLWISNRDNSGHTLITNDGSDSFPAWSPQGQTIAFSRNVDSNVDIYTVDVNGGNLQRLTDTPGPDTLPLYTPDGQIIFRSARPDNWGIWKMNGDGTEQHEIIPNAGVGPDWAYSRMDVQ